MKPRARIWIEDRGKPLFGDGKIALLDAIERLGSMNKAAKEFEMSYLHAQKKIKTLEKRLGIKLVETSIGGKQGGGSILTEEGKNLIRKYRKFRDEVDAVMQDRFEKIFELEKQEMPNSQSEFEHLCRI